MNTHLYIVRHEIEGDTYVSPCVGDAELIMHSRMAEHFGARLLSVSDMESALRCFVSNCNLEGEIREWLCANN